MKGLTFLGTGPNSGKSTVAVGFIVLARQQGVEITPFKPVAVADLADWLPEPTALGAPDPPPRERRRDHLPVTAQPVQRPVGRSLWALSSPGATSHPGREGRQLPLEGPDRTHESWGAFGVRHCHRVTPLRHD